MIKSTVENEKPLVKYPILKINLSKTIVLFNGKRTGIVVRNGTEIYPIGSFSTSWCEENFINYTGSITMKNNEE